jgi:hypothetical protein
MASTTQNLLDHPNSMQRLASPNRLALIIFGYMQVLDLLSTLAFLQGGVQEANPIVRIAMEATRSPIVGLTVVKSLGLMMGVYCWRSRRVQLLERVNVFFALLVAYNLCCLILALEAR